MRHFTVDLPYALCLNYSEFPNSCLLCQLSVKAIAQMKPYYAVFRDSSMANDSVATNFEQIFETYSPDTVRKVL